MTMLKEIVRVGNNITETPSKTINIIHNLLFESIPTDRKNRKRVREFSGFEFEGESEEEEKKKKFMKKSFSASDLFAVVSVLGIDRGTVDEMIDDLCGYLRELDKLKQKISDDMVREQAERDEEEQDEKSDDDQEDEDKRQNSDQDDLKRLLEGLNLNGRRYEDQHKFSLSFRDVEGALKTFDGKDGYPVSKWISDFEETAILMGWSELQSFVFAKKSLDGLAKLFVQGEKGLTSWSALKEALKDEFGEATSSMEIHKLLTERRKKREETLQEYFLVMREIASRGDVEQASLFQYVIDGIDDESGTKLLLYGARDAKDFKEKMKSYEMAEKSLPKKSMKGQHTGQHSSHGGSKGTHEKDRKRWDHGKKKSADGNGVQKCYNCGDSGHSSRECEHKAKGKKCFNCNEFGHIAGDCPKERKKQERRDESKSFALTSTGNNFKCKEVKLCNQQVTALIDCGSQLNLLRQNIYETMEAPGLKRTNIVLTGFGRNLVSPQGYFTTVIEVDESNFETDVYVVSDDAMKLDMVVGNDLLDQGEVILNKKGVTIRKTEVPIMCIRVADEPELDIDSHASDEKRKEIQDLVASYVPEKTKTTDVKMKITLKEEQPMFCRPRRLSPKEKEIVDKQVEEWLRDGVIEPSSSEYSSQVVVVKKKNGSHRVCVDYRKLNRISVKDRYPMPLIEDLLDRLQDAAVFCTLDLKNGFFHVEVEKGSRHYLAFVTHSGEFQYIRVPFGYTNSPAVFQRFINTVFWVLIRENIVFIYMDDLIIPARDDDDAIEKLKRTLKVAAEFGLEMNFAKCQFLKRKVQFLGYSIQRGQIQPSTEKTLAVQDFPEPKTLTALQSFLGLAGYFRKFIPNFSIVAKPLSDLLRGQPEFKFGEEQRRAFVELKNLLSAEPVLKIYSPKFETELHTDASKNGYGAVLLQKCPDDEKLHPVSYMSKKTTVQEEKYSSYELEILAVVEALKKYRVYLLGIPFKIVTDCMAFQKTMSKRDLAPKVARWAMKLEEFSYTIEHRAGTRMRHVDALSRCSAVLFGFPDSLAIRIKSAQGKDDGISAIKALLEKEPYEDYVVRDGILFKFVNGRDILVVPKSMHQEIIRIAHEKGHYAAKRTEEDVKEEYYITDLTNKVKRVIANCVKCLVVNRKRGKKEGFLHPLFKESEPLHTYHMDHVGPLDSTHKNYNHILVVIDAFTKFTWLYPVKTTKASEVIAKMELQKTNFGNPVQVITDRGPCFTSREFEDYCEEESIKHILVTTGLPRANGQVERVNAVVSPIIAKLSIDDPTKWYRVVPSVQRAINSTFQRSIGRSPFELLTGVKMHNENDLHIVQLLEEELINLFEDKRDEMREDAKRQIEKVQAENRASFNRGRKEPAKYEVGDLVAIKRTQLGPHQKLKVKHLGPYRVTRVKTNNTYDVRRESASHEGPGVTTTCAEYMKPWIGENPSSESDESQDGRVWESKEEFLGFPPRKIDVARTSSAPSECRDEEVSTS